MISRSTAVLLVLALCAYTILILNFARIGLIDTQQAVTLAVIDLPIGLILAWLGPRLFEQHNNQVPELERVFFRNQLFEELVSILYQLRSPVLVRLVITYSVWRSRSESEKIRFLGANDFALLNAFYGRVNRRNRFYSHAAITAVQDAQYESSRLEIINDVRRLFNTIPWLEVRRSEVDWRTE
jgi:hypothetical protein